MKGFVEKGKMSVKKVIVQATAGASHVFHTAGYGIRCRFSHTAAGKFKDSGYQYYRGGGCHHPCKECHGICTGIPAAGQFFNEQCN